MGDIMKLSLELDPYKYDCEMPNDASLSEVLPVLVFMLNAMGYTYVRALEVADTD
jgi:hypothetical protein